MQIVMHVPPGIVVRGFGGVFHPPLVLPPHPTYGGAAGPGRNKFTPCSSCSRIAKYVYWRGRACTENEFLLKEPNTYSSSGARRENRLRVFNAPFKTRPQEF